MKIIVIEDNPDHFELIEDAFEGIREINTQIVWCKTLLTGAEKMLSEHFDICLCDLKLPDSTIAETMQWLSSKSSSLPVVTLTSLHSIEIAQTLLNKGVQDYIYKDELTPQLLYKTCRYAIERFRHKQEISAYSKDMQVFCASLSHDFNGHISRITGVAKALEEELKQRTTFTESETRWFEYLETSTTDLHELVSSLQDYLSIEYANQVFDTVNLESVFANVFASLRSSLQVEFQTNMPSEMANVSGNAALLQVLFQNLIANSLKFNDNIPKIDISTRDNGNYIEITCQDNGIGFDSSHARTIFSAFSKLENGKKYGGSGLGLSIVKRITDHHHGSIEAHSELGLGSKFIVNFQKA